MKNEISRVVILIATYGRPEGLASLLKSLQNGETQVHQELIVVDNGETSSDEVRLIATNSKAEYFHEPAPGIVAARNRALEEVASKTFDAYIFVDDDETVCDDWMAHLINTAGAYGADVVGGPVVPRYTDNVPTWVRKFGFFGRFTAPTGADVKWPATNNILIRREVLDALEKPRFSAAFSSTGGSDTELFDRVRDSGAVFVWCAEAQVQEGIDSDRANSAWLWRRGVRLGNVSARMMHKRGSSRQRIWFIGLARIILAAPLAAVKIVRGRVEHAGAALMNLPKGVGMLRATSGRYVHEYARSDKLGDAESDGITGQSIV